VQVFCLLDDLCKAICIENSTDKPKGGRSSSLSLSEVMAILIYIAFTSANVDDRVILKSALKNFTNFLEQMLVIVVKMFKKLLKKMVILYLQL